MYLKLIQARAIVPIDYYSNSNILVNSCIRMPSQLVKCAFGFTFRRFNDPKTNCVPLSVELGSEQGGRAPPPISRALKRGRESMCEIEREYVSEYI